VQLPHVRAPLINFNPELDHRTGASPERLPKSPLTPHRGLTTPIRQASREALIVDTSSIILQAPCAPRLKYWRALARRCPASVGNGESVRPLR
jgi:hypothetical protein